MPTPRPAGTPLARGELYSAMEIKQVRQPARLFYVLDLLKILVYNHFREERIYERCISQIAGLC